MKQNDLFLSQHVFDILFSRTDDLLICLVTRIMCDDNQQQYYLIGKSVIEIWSGRSSVSSPPETGIDRKRIEAVRISWWRCCLRAPALQKFLFHYNLEQIRLLQNNVKNILNWNLYCFIPVHLLISHHVTKLKTVLVQWFSVFLIEVWISDQIPVIWNAYYGEDLIGFIDFYAMLLNQTYRFINCFDESSNPSGHDYFFPSSEINKFRSKVREIYSQNNLKQIQLLRNIKLKTS